MRAAAAARRTTQPTGISSRFDANDDNNDMLASLADLMVDDRDSNSNVATATPANSGGDASRGAGGGAAGGGGGAPMYHTLKVDNDLSPRAQLMTGLQALQEDFKDELGMEWWYSSLSDGAETTSAELGSSVLNADGSTAVPSEMSNSDRNSLLGGSDCAAAAAAGGGDMGAAVPSTAIEGCPAGLAANMAAIAARLDRLPKPQLLAYASRITILLGNWYGRAQELGGNVTPSTDHQRSGAWTAAGGGGTASESGIIDWATTSRPMSQMTTFSDWGPSSGMSMSASVASLAHLPAVETTVRARVEGDIEEGTKTINDYVVVDSIGSGSFGTVELGVTLSGEPRAIKALKRSALLGRNEALIKREIAIMKKLRHDNVVRLFEVIDDPGENIIYLVMKYCKNGPLVNMRSDMTCDTMPLVVAKSLLRQLLSGLHYLHLRRIVHRDIKPENILLDHNNVPCYIDFGVSGTLHKKSRTAVTQGIEGTPAFWAPELFARNDRSSHSQNNNNSSSRGRKKSSSSNQNQNQQNVPAPPIDLMAADIWSLGATFYAAVCGVAPFVASNQPDLAQKVCNDELRLPDHLPASWKDLFSRMLDKDPIRRIKIPALKTHAVFTEDGNDTSSPRDDMRVTDREIDDSIGTIRRQYVNSGESLLSEEEDGGVGGGGGGDIRDANSDDDQHPGSYGPKTPRQQEQHGGGGGGGGGGGSGGKASGSAAAAPSSSSHATSSNSRAMFHRKLPNVRKVAASSPRDFQQHQHNSSPNAIAGGGASSGAGGGLQRAYSTSRMPLRNVVRASDLAGGGAGANVHLPPLHGASTTARARPQSSGTF